MNNYERAKRIDGSIGKVMNDIVKEDLPAVQNTEHYTQMSLIFLREIMYNTAIIADKLTDKNTNRKAGDLGDEDKPEKIDA